MEKRVSLFLIVLSVLCLIMGVLTACDMSEKIPNPRVVTDVYIYDESDIIENSVEEQLNKMLIELEEKTGVEFFVITVDGLIGRTIDTYANDLFSSIGIGKKDKDNGVLFLISKNDIEFRLEAGKGLKKCLNVQACDIILDDYFVPYREKEEYTKATDNTVKVVLNVLAEEYQVDIAQLDKVTPAHETYTEEKLPWYVWVIIIIFLIFVMAGVIAD